MVDGRFAVLVPDDRAEDIRWIIEMALECQRAYAV